MPRLLWQPTESFQQQTHLRAYMRWLSETHHRYLDTYDALWQWSIDDTKAFWQSVADYFEVMFHAPHTCVHTDDPMPDTRWFPGSTLNYAEHIFRQANEAHPALLFQSERHALQATSWAALRQQVAAFRTFLTESGVGTGDCVVAFLPNIPEATVAFLAACSLGAIWSSCSPDFGSSSVVDRFQQIEPKVLIAVDGYQYNGKPYDKQVVVQEIVAALPSLQQVVLLPYLDAQSGVFIEGALTWDAALDREPEPLTFAAVPFDHPLWVLYSSGTTGMPKAITHSHGGALLEHLKYLAFHNDVHPGERFFWFTTTGWMMWNFVQAALLMGATIVLYDGSPGFPDMQVLWQLASAAQLNHFGTSAPYLVACMKGTIRPDNQNLSAMRSLSSTGAPLPPEAFDWVYEAVKQDLWLCSMSGGTDVCTAFVGGVPTEPVYEGEIQRRALGCAMYAFDEAGKPVVGEVGEMVITRPMPSMPIYFWNDPDKANYRAAYFEDYTGIWRHGDWLEITPRNTLIIRGRSDATLNRHGIRIGTAEIYRAIDQLPKIKDSLIVNLELDGGRHYMPLFVLLAEGAVLDEALKQTVNQLLRSAYTPRHVPDEIIAVPDIPYTLSGKKLESPVKKILMGIQTEKAANRGAMRNPESLDFFIEFRKHIG